MYLNHEKLNCFYIVDIVKSGGVSEHVKLGTSVVQLDVKVTEQAKTFFNANTPCQSEDMPLKGFYGCHSFNVVTVLCYYNYL